MSRSVEVVRTYLQLRTPSQLRAAPPTDPSVQFVRRAGISVPDARRLYHDVGYQWYWRDRDAWSDAQYAAHLEHPNVIVWECLRGNETAGFVEMQRHDDGSVEIAYFGLVAAAIGHGIGKVMLTRAVQEAWALGPTRVWLHTCTLDSPHALPNYLARGFEIERRETLTQLLPE